VFLGQLSNALFRISDQEFAQETQAWDRLGVKLYHLRWGLFVANIFFGLTGHHLHWGMTLWLILPMAGLLMFTEWLRKRFNVQLLNTLLVPIDLLLITSAVVLSGGLRSDSYLMYFVEIILICLFIGGKVGFTVAVFSMGMYAAAVFDDLQTSSDWMVFAYRATMIMIFAVGVAYLGQILRKQVVLNRKMAEENHRLACTDLLTGLGNSRLLYEQLDELLVKFNSDRTPFSMLMFDCDNLKKVNDRYGHDAGDLLIGHVADYARQVFEPAGAVFRYAGDEFYVLFADIDPAVVQQLAEQFIDGLAGYKFSYEEGEFVTSVSVGMVHFVQSLRSHVLRSDAVRLADQALYESKNKGKACLTTYRVCA